MRQYKAHYLQAAPERLYLPSTEGGRGLKSVAHAWEKEVIAVASYLSGNGDVQVKGAVRFLREQMKPAKKGIKKRPQRTLSTWRGCRQTEQGTDKGAGKGSNEGTGEKVKGKSRHGIYAKQREKVGVDQRATSAWLREGKLTPRTVAIVMASVGDQRVPDQFPWGPTLLQVQIVWNMQRPLDKMPCAGIQRIQETA